MKLLLHICCAPCSIYPFQKLKSEGFNSIVGFFYNPNIHPYLEYKQRKDALDNYSKKASFSIIFHKYNIENFFREISGNEEIGIRCRVCWRMRLEETARFGKDNDFDAFTTTLLVSPYQDQDRIRQIGEDISKKIGIKFLSVDFRNGFRQAQAEAKRIDLYRQKYCGCVFSEREMYQRKSSE